MPSDDITATIKIDGAQQAVKDIKKVEKEFADLQDQKAVLTVKFGTEGAKNQLAEIDRQMEALRSEHPELDVKVRVDQAIQAMDDLLGETNKVKVAGAAIAKALGPDLASKVNVDQLAQGFADMNLSIEEVAQNADRLGGKVKQVTEQGGLEALSPNLTRASGAMREFGGQAERTHSAISNMTGEAAGQLTELAGAEGGAGIAIGNLVELLTSTALASKGAESGMAALGSEVLAAAGPLAGIAVALFAVNQIMDAMKEGQAETKAFDTEQLKQFNDAIKEGGSVLLNYQTELEKTGTVAVETGSKMGPAWAQAIPGLDQVTKALGLMDKFGQDIQEIIPALNKAKVSSDEWVAVVTSDKPVQAMDEFRIKVQAANLTADEQADILIGALKAQEAYATQSNKTGEAQTFFAASVSDINAALEAGKDPLDRATAKWKILFDDLKDGKADTQAAADAFNFLEQTLGLTKDQIIAIVNKHFADELRDQEQAAKDWDDAIKQMASDLQTFIDNLDQAAQNMANAQTALDQLGGAFSQMSINEGAINAAFALGDAPLEFLDRITSIHDGMRDFFTFISKDLKGKIPNIFDPNDVHAGDFLAKIRSLRGPIQQEVTNAFETGGAPAAQATAEQYVNELFSVLKGKLSKEDIRSLLGLGDMTVKLKIAVDLADKEKAQKELEILTGLRGANAWTASITLALEEGAISPQAAKILIERELKKAQVVVPSKLATPDVGKAKSDADRFGAMPSNAVILGSKVDDPSDKSKSDAQTNGQTYATNHPINWPSVLLAPRPRTITEIFRNPFISDAGGTIPSGGIGLVAERRPEILNERYLATQPMLVPAGTRVTSGARTARILRTRGTRGLRRYDAGGTVTAVPVNITINGAALGARYDIMRTVRNAAKDAVRLLGTRP